MWIPHTFQYGFQVVLGVHTPNTTKPMCLVPCIDSLCVQVVFHFSTQIGYLSLEIVTFL